MWDYIGSVATIVAVTVIALMAIKAIEIAGYYLGG